MFRLQEQQSTNSQPVENIPTSETMLAPNAQLNSASSNIDHSIEFVRPQKHGNDTGSVRTSRTGLTGLTRLQNQQGSTVMYAEPQPPSYVSSVTQYQKQLDAEQQQHDEFQQQLQQHLQQQQQAGGNHQHTVSVVQLFTTREDMEQQQGAEQLAVGVLGGNQGLVKVR